MKTLYRLLILVLISIFAISCEKEEPIPPTIIYGPNGFGFGPDFTTGTNQFFRLHFVADKGNYNLKEIEVKRYYDNQTNKDAIIETFAVTDATTEHFELEYTLTTRSITGTEYWTFSAIDKKGNKSSLSVKIIVQ